MVFDKDFFEANVCRVGGLSKVFVLFVFTRFAYVNPS